MENSKETSCHSIRLKNLQKKCLKSPRADTSRLRHSPGNPQPGGVQPGSYTHSSSQRGLLAQKREYKAQGEEETNMSQCYMPLTCNGMKIFQMRGSGRPCESLSKLILPASQSSSFSRPHTQALFEATDIIKTVMSFSKRKKKHFHLLHIVHLQLLKFHQHGRVQRMTRADMLGDAIFLLIQQHLLAL